MKRFLLLITLVLSSFTVALAQTDTIMYAQDLHNEWLYLCFNQHERAIIYAPSGCNDIHWLINGVQYTENPVILDGNVTDFYNCNFNGWNCEQFAFHIIFIQPTTPEETTATLWKHEYGTVTIEPVGADSLEMYDYHWSTGETTPTIEVTAPGTYTCDISDQCATATRTFIVRDNVEVELATCDLETNLNMVTWPTTSAQAEYISQVEIKRDGLLVGTAPYTDGQFIDNIGSDAASRTYTVTAIATDGTPCPITSYPKETIHMAYLTGINNTIEVNWNTPTGYDLLGYNICEWHDNDGSLSVIDYVGASVTSYTCSQSQFDEGYIVVQGVEAGKDSETRLLSNRSSETVGLGENGPSTGSGTLTVYPNPAQGAFTVEGMGRLSITNVLGQTVLTREIDGKETVELPLGIYFVKLNGQTRKIVVE